MSVTERDNIIKQGVQTRRNTYRGKDITEYYNDGKLFSMIKSGKFDDIYVGDYIVSKTQDESKHNIVWLIADLDNYLGMGDQDLGLQLHHATIIPAYMLEQDKMNPSDSALAGASKVPSAESLGAYKGSEMYQVTLNTVLSRYIEPDFCKSDSDCHIIEYRSLVTDNVKVDSSNQWGANNGASSDWKWEDRKLDLMSEVNVFGTTVWSSSGYDIGIDNRQYAIFQLRPELINQDLSSIAEATPRRYGYWLKAVSHSTTFTNVGSGGGASSDVGHASNLLGVRPRFLID